MSGVERYFLRLARSRKQSAALLTRKLQPTNRLKIGGSSCADPVGAAILFGRNDVRWRSRRNADIRRREVLPGHVDQFSSTAKETLSAMYTTTCPGELHLPPTSFAPWPSSR